MPNLSTSLQDRRLPITALIAAKNEEANLAKCLASLRGFARVIVLDSNSTDATATIAEQFCAEVIQFVWDGTYPKKRQWALDKLAFSTAWVFLIDADEEVPETLSRELANLTEKMDRADPVAYAVKKEFHFLGKRFLFGGFSHSAITLFRPGKVRFERLSDEGFIDMDMEVHERLIVDGRIGKLRAGLVHNDFKGLKHYIDRHNKYSTWEALVRFANLSSGTWGQRANPANLFGDVQQRRRFLKQIAMRMPGEPWLWFLYHYLIRLGFLEGKRGLIASQIRAQYIANVRAKLYELQLSQAFNKKTGSETITK